MRSGALLQIHEITASRFQPEGAHAVFWRYWRELQKKAGGVPRRADFDPLKIARIMPNLAMSDYVDENTQIVRIIGGNHDSLWPPKMAGRNLFDHIDADMVASRKAIYKEIVNRPCACFVHDKALGKEGQVLPYSGLILPTLSKEGRPTVFIGSYVFLDDQIVLKMAAENGIDRRVSNEATFIDLEN